MARIRETLTRWSHARVDSALITGERGAGKTFLAQALHAGSHRRSAPCLPYACADAYAPAIALFGRPGVRVSGLLAAALGGTVILGDVDQLATDVQGALLEWVNGHRAVSPLVIGLSRSAEAQGPLLTWLGRASIDVPALRDRPADVLPLARKLLTAAGQRLGRHFIGFTSDAERRLLAHRWPGNVRELKETVERIALAVPGGVIRQEHITVAGWDAAPAWLPSGEPRPLREIEDAYIDHVIEFARGNKTRAAKLLGIARETLRSRTLSGRGPDPNSATPSAS